jgi:hypothetical protein
MERPVSFWMERSAGFARTLPVVISLRKRGYFGGAAQVVEI